MAQAIPMVTPEEAGIPGESIAAFLHALEERALPLHSFLLLRRGKLAFETYYAPFSRHSLHRMFSVSKSFTSLAVGLLAQEGALSLDDRIAPYFRDKWPSGGLNGHLAAATIRQLLSMTSPHCTSSYKLAPQADWVGSFFQVPGDHRPGDCFLYDTSATHTLAALCERLSGKPLLEYLREKCLNEIGFSQEAYFLKDSMGVSLGGSGLMATPEDVLRVGWLLCGNGRWEGRQLLPPDYLRAATARQTDTFFKGGFWDCMQGYGYGFWRTTHRGFAMYGMGGQLCVCLPDRDMVLMVTADTQGRQGGVQLIYDAFWATIWPALRDGALPPMPAGAQRELFPPRSLPVVTGAATSPWAGRADGVLYRLEENRAGFTGVQVAWAKGEGCLTLLRGGETMAFRFGMGENRRTDGPLPYAASAAWRDERTLLMTAWLLGEALGNVSCQLCFSHQGVTLQFQKNVEYMWDGLDGAYSGAPASAAREQETLHA